MFKTKIFKKHHWKQLAVSPLVSLRQASNLRVTTPNTACSNCLESQEQKPPLKGKPVRLIIFPAGQLRRPRPSTGNANRWAASPIQHSKSCKCLEIFMAVFFVKQKVRKGLLLCLIRLTLIQTQVHILTY